MKALSLRQPWLHAVLYLGKKIENRRWNTYYRGPILLHAAKECTKEELEDAYAWMENAKVLDGPDAPRQMPSLSDLPRGGICGRARIVDVIPPNATQYPDGVDPRWHMRDQYGFVLADVELLPFVSCRGRLRIFNLPNHNQAETCRGYPFCPGCTKCLPDMTAEEIEAIRLERTGP